MAGDLFAPLSTLQNLKTFEINLAKYLKFLLLKIYLVLLKSSKMIGLDSEFIMTSTSFEIGGISIFQISNDKNAFIFDMEKVSNYPEFIEFFFDLLGDKNITKVKNL